MSTSTSTSTADPAVAAATAASSPPPHPQGDRHDHDQNAPAVSLPKQAIAPADPPIRVRLPVGGWKVGFRIQPDGRTVIEVTDQDETLTGLVASTRLPITSIDAGWSGLTRDPAGGRHWWALAIGHVPADAGQPAVTFTRRTRHRPGVAPPDAVDGLWFAHDGLWVAAATGHHTLARLTTRSATRVRRLRPVTARPAATAQAHPTAR